MTQQPLEETPTPDDLREAVALLIEDASALTPRGEKGEEKEDQFLFKKKCKILHVVVPDQGTILFCQNDESTPIGTFPAKLIVTFEPQHHICLEAGIDSASVVGAVEIRNYTNPHEDVPQSECENGFRVIGYPVKGASSVPPFILSTCDTPMSDNPVHNSLRMQLVTAAQEVLAQAIIVRNDAIHDGHRKRLTQVQAILNGEENPDA